CGIFLLLSTGTIGAVPPQYDFFVGLLDYLPVAALPAARFIAFAYTYHYLNWFSKTRVIGWHEMPGWWMGTAAALWAAAVGLYLYDYRLGFNVLFALSILHVYLAFQLDHKVLVNG